MEFIEGFPKSLGKTVIWVVVDRLTKYAHFIALSHPYSASDITKLFMENIFKLHGMPEDIVSDRDHVFTSKLWQELFLMQGVTLSTSTAYHPQYDGQTEVLNRCLETYLRCFALTHQHLGLTTWCLRSGGLIPLSIPPFTQPHMKHFMVNHPLSTYPIWLEILNSRR